MPPAFTESTVEEAALAWLEASGWWIAHGPDLIQRNRALHRFLVDGVTVEYRLPSGKDCWRSRG